MYGIDLVVGEGPVVGLEDETPGQAVPSVGEADTSNRASSRSRGPASADIAASMARAVIG